MSQITKLATSTALVVLGTFWIATPAAAEKTAAQIKCEEEGGSWVDKGNGNTFCFKKLPPMQKAGGPSVSGSSDASKPTLNTSRSNTRNVAAPAHAINTKGTGATGRMAPPATAAQLQRCSSSSTDRGVVSPAGTMTGTANVSAPSDAALGRTSGTGLITGAAAGGPVTMTATYRDKPAGQATSAGDGTCPEPSNGNIKKSKSNISTN